MQRWEYKKISAVSIRYLSEGMLNQEGSEGWELVNVVFTGEYRNSNDVELIFKRPIKKKPLSPKKRMPKY